MQMIRDPMVRSEIMVLQEEDVLQYMWIILRYNIFFQLGNYWTFCK